MARDRNASVIFPVVYCNRRGVFLIFVVLINQANPDSFHCISQFVEYFDFL